MLLIARLVRLAAGIAVGLIVVGIALVVLDANEGNWLVSNLLDAARWLVQPFKDVFHLDNAKANTAANWGLAAVVYAAVAALIVRLLVAAGVGATTRRRAWRSEPAP